MLLACSERVQFVGELHRSGGDGAGACNFPARGALGDAPHSGPGGAAGGVPPLPQLRARARDGTPLERNPRAHLGPAAGRAAARPPPDAPEPAGACAGGRLVSGRRDATARPRQVQLPQVRRAHRALHAVAVQRAQARTLSRVPVEWAFRDQHGSGICFHQRVFALLVVLTIAGASIVPPNASLTSN